MALLELQDVEASYGQVKALHGVSIAVDEGSIVALLGANGAGKTTTLRAVSGLVQRSGGIVFDGKRIGDRPAEDIARLGIGHVPEGRGTMSNLSVWDNLRMGAYIRTDRERVKKDYERVFGYFPRLRERRHQDAGTLSGGEQQMLAIGRTLMLRPRLLLLDEPSLGLAPRLVREIFDILTTINQEERVTILVVEQNAALALKAAHHAYVLEVGRVAVSGSSADLRQNESVRKSYLGY